MAVDYVENMRRTDLIRVRGLAVKAGWSDDDLGALIHHFHPALIVRFDRDDVYLADRRQVSRAGVCGAQYDREKWAAELASLPPNESQT